MGESLKTLCCLVAHMILVQQQLASRSAYLLYNCPITETLSVVAITPTMSHVAFELGLGAVSQDPSLDLEIKFSDWKRRYNTIRLLGSKNLFQLSKYEFLKAVLERIGGLR